MSTVKSDKDGLIHISFSNQEVIRAFDLVESRGFNLRPLYLNIGEHLVNTTQKRFETSTAPDGSKWAPNAQSTYLSLLGKSHTNKNGKINSRGTNKVVTKKPLVLTGALMSDIHYQLLTDGLEVGTNKVYAAPQQFGAKKGEFGNMPKKNHPIPFGDIPKRELLGVSVEDEGAILAMAIEHMSVGVPFTF